MSRLTYKNRSRRSLRTLKAILTTVVDIPISPKYKGSVRKNDEAEASQLQMVLYGARVSDTQVADVDSKRTPMPYRKHDTPIEEADHVVKKRHHN